MSFGRFGQDTPRASTTGTRRINRYKYQPFKAQTKFKPPQDPFDFERGQNTIKAPRKYTEKLVSRSIKGEKALLSFADAVALGTIKSRDATGRADEQYASDFQHWLTKTDSVFKPKGRRDLVTQGTRYDKLGNEIKNNVGNRSMMHIPSCSDYITNMVYAQGEYKKKYMRLQLFGPTNVDEAFMYYKYIVTPSMDKNNPEQIQQFLSDYDFYMGHGQALEAGAPRAHTAVPDKPGDGFIARREIRGAPTAGRRSGRDSDVAAPDIEMDTADNDDSDAYSDREYLPSVSDTSDDDEYVEPLDEIPEEGPSGTSGVTRGRGRYVPPVLSDADTEFASDYESSEYTDSRDSSEDDTEGAGRKGGLKGGATEYVTASGFVGTIEDEPTEEGGVERDDTKKPEAGGTGGAAVVVDDDDDEEGEPMDAMYVKSMKQIEKLTKEKEEAEATNARFREAAERQREEYERKLVELNNKIQETRKDKSLSDAAKSDQIRHLKERVDRSARENEDNTRQAERQRKESGKKLAELDTRLRDAQNRAAAAEKINLENIARYANRINDLESKIAERTVLRELTESERKQLNERTLELEVIRAKIDGARKFYIQAAQRTQLTRDFYDQIRRDTIAAGTPVSESEDMAAAGAISEALAQYEDRFIRMNLQYENVVAQATAIKDERDTLREQYRELKKELSGVSAQLRANIESGIPATIQEKRIRELEAALVEKREEIKTARQTVKKREDTLNAVRVETNERAIEIERLRSEKTKLSAALKIKQQVEKRYLEDIKKAGFDADKIEDVIESYKYELNVKEQELQGLQTQVKAREDALVYRDSTIKAKESEIQALTTQQRETVQAIESVKRDLEAVKKESNNLLKERDDEIKNLKFSLQGAQRGTEEMQTAIRSKMDELATTIAANVTMRKKLQSYESEYALLQLNNEQNTARLQEVTALAESLQAKLAETTRENETLKQKKTYETDEELMGLFKNLLKSDTGKKAALNFLESEDLESVRKRINQKDLSRAQKELEGARAPGLKRARKRVKQEVTRDDPRAGGVSARDVEKAVAVVRLSDELKGRLRGAGKDKRRALAEIAYENHKGKLQTLSPIESSDRSTPEVKKQAKRIRLKIEEHTDRLNRMAYSDDETVDLINTLEALNEAIVEAQALADKAFAFSDLSTQKTFLKGIKKVNDDLTKELNRK